MELHQLRVLRELAERGSVRAAAEALYITPSAVSQHLKSLQRSAGRPLVTHEGRRLVLTDAGRALAAAAVEVEESMALARNAIQRDAERVDRVVSIVAFPSAGQLFLPRIAACFASADGPHVALADHDAAPEQTVALCGDYDVVIAHRWRIHRTGRRGTSMSPRCSTSPTTSPFRRRTRWPSGPTCAPRTSCRSSGSQARRGGRRRGSSPRSVPSRARSRRSDTGSTTWHRGRDGARRRWGHPRAALRR